nr:S-methyl-5-thioribose-1-phosphate isomerase [Hyphomonas sp. Mor2]
MKVDGRPYRTIWLNADGWSVDIIDQTVLPHEWRIETLRTVEDATRAIADMLVRGAPLIGATGAYGVALAAKQDPSDGALAHAADMLMAARPTAVNLQWAVERVVTPLYGLPESERAAAAYAHAARICDDDVEVCSNIGEHGVALVKAAQTAKTTAGPVNILTHCNAGWLATVDWGTAIAPIYKAHNAGIDVHVWVDETRPRNQGAHLTAWELAQHGVPHTLIVDNAGGHLMQHGLVDLCFVGTDRTTHTGDVCNKIGTYLKALAAHDNDVPFYVCAPSSSIDWKMKDGLKEIPIEERGGDEVALLHGRTAAGEVTAVSIKPDQTPVRNDAFDVTPRKYITGLVTERGVCDANEQALGALFPELVVA